MYNFVHIGQFFYRVLISYGATVPEFVLGFVN